MVEILEKYFNVSSSSSYILLGDLELLHIGANNTLSAQLFIYSSHSWNILKDSIRPKNPEEWCQALAELKQRVGYEW